MLGSWDPFCCKPAQVSVAKRIDLCAFFSQLYSSHGSTTPLVGANRPRFSVVLHANRPFQLVVALIWPMSCLLVPKGQPVSANQLVEFVGTDP